MTRFAVALMVAGSLFVSGVSAPVFAGNGNGNGNGNGTVAGCPPGLAKKSEPCVPPGQAKKWMLGERLPIRTPWYEVRDWERFGLPEPLDGSRYVRVDNEILRVAIATGIVLEALGVID